MIDESSQNNDNQRGADNMNNVSILRNCPVADVSKTQSTLVYTNVVSFRRIHISPELTSGHLAVLNLTANHKVCCCRHLHL